MISLFATAATIVGVIGVTFGLVFNAYQVRILANQTRTQNQIAKAESIYNGVIGLRDLYGVFVDRPELRKYFYDCVPTPVEQEERDRVIPLAEMLADTIDAVLHTIYRFGADEDHSDWTDYTKYMLAHSPTLTELVLDHRIWWPEIASMLPERSSQIQEIEGGDGSLPAGLPRPT